MTNEIKARNLERIFFFVRNVFHLLLRNNLRFFRFNEASNVSCKARCLSKIVVCI